MTNIVIKCVSIEEGFVKSVYDYLYAELEQQALLKEGKNLQINNQLVKLVPDSDEILVDASAKVPTGMIKWILNRLLESDPSRFKDFQLIEFEDTLTLSKILPASQMGLYCCELCSFSTLYEEELYRHRVLHAGFG